jgi:SAM-dependent methyltransferase
MTWRPALIAGIVGAGIAYWARTHPSACPYAMRFLVEGPHPGIPRNRLLEILEPRPGQRLLEIGPGTGYYSLDVASRLDGGKLDVFDVQREMLDHVARKAEQHGLGNIVPTEGDARSLPYPDDSFDAAFLVTVLGEVPDQDAALRELGRVLKPGGALVVGETMFGDPHVVTLGKLRERAANAGFSFERHLGSLLGYFARFRTPAA